ncbi:MAG: hypothetical protein KBC57_04030 [Neisseriaceae bacterium]|nr:hypothetical protein [Neisseriaceae bacterium]MBP6861507.1 hypothetical protein [Neisseriaceae bacterium]
MSLFFLSVGRVSNTALIDPAFDVPIGLGPKDTRPESWPIKQAAQAALFYPHRAMHGHYRWS